mmetsp:Transcript_1163/g.3373  ORF Transcript_1163/g.3373 Transcript_1163/m.3373 type:complete len:91 (-) Transcript_1163:2080-2352(-)
MFKSLRGPLLRRQLQLALIEPCNWEPRSSAVDKEGAMKFSTNTPRSTNFPQTVIVSRKEGGKEVQHTIHRTYDFLSDKETSVYTHGRVTW